jgi:sialate O-acetylesterase
MIISEGLFDNMVMQRSANDCCSQTVAGICKSDGEVYFKVSEGRCSSGLKKWTACGKALKGRFSAVIKYVPVGGPYNIELCIRSASGRDEFAAVKNVLVGDVWLLGGQSNMEGYGILAFRDRPNKYVRAFYMNDVWDTAHHPVHNIYKAVDQVHRNFLGINPPKRNPRRAVGPGLYFGLAMYEQTGLPQGVIACAHGGTTMELWDPSGRRIGSESLYGAMLRRVQKNGGKAAGLVWYQGCSDACCEFHSQYTQRMVRFVKALRKDLKAPELPIVMAQISRTCGLQDGVSWNSVQHQQYRLPAKIKYLAVVPTVDLTLDDGVHIDQQSSAKLGKSLCQAALFLTNKNYRKYAPIELRKVEVLKNSITSCADLKVTFSNVIGALQSDGSRAEGFCLLDKNSADIKGIYKTICSKNAVILKTQIAVSEMGDYRLAYGHGCNPYCNIIDAAGRSLPVFSGLALGRPRLISGFIRSFMVSRLFDAAQCPDNVSLKNRSLDWKQMTFKDDFANLHDLFTRHPGSMQRVFYGFGVKCNEDMQLVFHLGYDGPVKLTADAKEVFCDPKGTNPALPTDARIPLKLAAGTHEVIISLDSNLGAAYGIFLRIERKLQGRKSERLDSALPQIIV